jgi:hypothetical protein
MAKTEESHINLQVGYPVPGPSFRNCASDKETRKSSPFPLYTFNITTERKDLE